MTMEFDEIVVKENPGLCRCCLSEGCYKDLGSEHIWMNETEVYAEMLLDCFDISISQQNEGPNGLNRLICEVCITRLRDACNFKKQVLESEKKFVDMVGRGEFKSKMLVYQARMKREGAPPEESAEETVEYLDEDIDFDEEVEELNDEPPPTVSEVTVSSRPVKSKRGRPKKKGEKSEKKAKVVKMEEKPKTSKAVAKDKATLAYEKYVERQHKEDLVRVITVILENSTIMPFRYFSNKYMCFFCCCTFIDSAQLKAHTIEEHKDAKLRRVLRSLLRCSRIKLDISEIVCKLCPKAFDDFDTFLNHISNTHNLKFNKEISTSVFTFKLSDDGMSCQDCGEQFLFFGPLLRHAHKFHNKYTSFLCQICGDKFVAKLNLDSHIKNVHSLKNRQCLKCDKVFKTPYALQVHKEKVHRINSLKCPKCPAILPSKYLKKSHLALVHDVKRLQFSCDVCDRVFTVKSRLVQHQLRTHQKIKTFSCEVCGFKVFNKDLLKRHMVRHDESRPFQCEYCNKSFQRRKTLDVHIRVHTNDHRYTCNQCGKGFVQVTSYKLHMKVHHAADERSS